MSGRKRAVKAWLEPGVYSALRMWAAATPGMTISKMVDLAIRRELARLQAQQKPLDVTNSDKLEDWTEEEMDPRVRAVSRSLRTATSDGNGNAPRRGLRKTGRRPDDA
ncbi:MULTISPECIES: hypothetical protein [Bifidobacterium]|uniref:Uncharacterized protein n=2 Tax=Bifidobacterium TaxID=1678 RepID=A0A6L4WYH1_9BIFI|nr:MULTISPECIES: hypothetical protein [Bifidobacterium]KAB8287348.1 hypothetical protein DSM100688_1707 [Bifidobacterium ramosum]MBT1181055.1 hypothetical protein [Bifidobacterium sp. CP2]NEG55596.1 hypothetical protein [Bifidobacterium platyrrhinorum]NEG72384.1 hypothetical protein [Bifidobacterium ramosum]